MCRCISRPGRAFNLIELTIYVALLVVLLGAMYLLLMAGMRDLQYGVSYQTVQEQATVALKKLSGELANAANNWPNLYIYQNSPGAVLFLSASLPLPQAQNPALEHEPATGTLLYQKWVCYYQDPSSNLLYRSENTGSGTPALPTAVPATPTVPFPPIPTISSMNVTGAGASIIASDIYALEVSNVFSTPANLLLGIYAQDATASDRFTQIYITQRVALQN